MLRGSEPLSCSGQLLLLHETGYGLRNGDVPQATAGEFSWPSSFWLDRLANDLQSGTRMMREHLRASSRASDGRTGPVVSEHRAVAIKHDEGGILIR